MKKVFIILIFYLFNVSAKAQQATPLYQDYGKIDTADLEMKDCDFEKGASAEILFDKAVVENGMMQRHVRVKILNSAGLGRASIRIRYLSYLGITDIFSLKGETINLVNNKIEITPIDSKSIYREKIDKYFSFFAFALPNVKVGSVIEYKFSTIPLSLTWYFQSDIPTRYSEIKMSFSGRDKFSYIPHIDQPFVKNVGSDPSDIYQDKALANIHSLPDEVYMGEQKDNLERMQYLGTERWASSWRSIGQLLVRLPDFGREFNVSLTGENEIIKQAKSLKFNDEKISYIFNQVKNSMHWNEITNFYVIDGTSVAWDKKTGNSTEINLILYHLLKKSGIDAYPMLISSKNNGRINPFNPNPYSFDNTVVYIPIDTTNIDSQKYYVLDATDKFNLFNVVPKDELNTYGLCIDEDNYNSRPIFLENNEPAKKTIFLKADIKPDGKMEGTVEISSFSYNRINNIDLYKKDGEKKFEEYLSDNDNNLKISSLKVENIDTDTLPFVQKANFTLDLSGSDDNYIYFNPNLFSSLNKNPFLDETRYNDIEFGYRDKVVINDIFTIPIGYKLDAKPANVSMVSQDASLTLRRVINEQDGVITVSYIINRKKATYFKEDYADFHEFYKKMYEMLNEQIVLKKS